MIKGIGLAFLIGGLKLISKHFNEMAKYLIGLGRRYDLSVVFNDFLTIAICSFHRTNIQSGLSEKDPANEELYFATIDKYKKEELNDFAKAMAEAQMHIYKNPYSDVFGDFYMDQISHGLNGEYFTPEPMCEMMAMLQAPKDSVALKTVLDTACGSGRMLIRFADLNPDNFFYGSDVSNSCAKMSVMNFFWNGMRGEIAWMNALSLEWFGGWSINKNGLGIVPIDKEQSRIWSPPPKKSEPPPLPSEFSGSKPMGPATQLTIF